MAAAASTASTTTQYRSRFCDRQGCGSLMVILTLADGASAYRCRRCENRAPMESTQRITVLRRNYNGTAGCCAVADDPALLNDPTYALIHKECPRCTATKVTFTKIDSDRLLYRYTCSNGHSWSNELAGNRFRT